MKINTVCLPIKFEKDETFESFKAATVSGFGDVFLNGREVSQQYGESHQFSDGPNGSEWNKVDVYSFYFLVIKTRKTNNLFNHDNLFDV